MVTVLRPPITAASTVTMLNVDQRTRFVSRLIIVDLCLHVAGHPAQHDSERARWQGRHVDDEHRVNVISAPALLVIGSDRTPRRS